MDLKIKGQKINLRKLRKSDAPFLYQNANDKEVTRYTTLPYPCKLERVQEFIKETHPKIRKETAYELGIELKETGQIIGVMSLMHIDPASKNAEAGYWLGKKYWGQGLAKEALKLILEFGFKKLELIRIYARVMHPNIASARLLERCGLKYEGRMRKSTFTNGKWMDDLMYAILREEYKR
jgi:RimJ/RimL family protein N-acetyltransferase